MSVHYPLHFTLEDGIKVEVQKTGANTYDFTLRPESGSARSFTYTDDGTPKGEVEASLDFDQLNALRRFWLEQESFL